MQNGEDRAGGFWREGDAPGESRDVRFVDRAGVPWHAYERRRPGQRTALVFESANAVRLALEKLIGPELGHVVHEIKKHT